MKRSKQLQSMVDECNAVLKQKRYSFKKDNSGDINYESSIFNFTCLILMKNKCYDGYNEYYPRENGGVTCSVLVGVKDIPEEEKYIQIL